MTLPFRVLAVAAASGRVGMVFLVRWELQTWTLSRAAAESPQRAATMMKEWIAANDARIVVVEKLDQKSRKGQHAQSLIVSMTKSAKRQQVIVIPIERPHSHKNKYEEAKELATRHPDLLPRLPRREKIYHTEPRETVLFEALALAEELKHRDVAGIAAAMD